MKTELARKLLSGLSLWVLLFALSSCGSKMDEDAAAAYFDESPAVTLYATCFFDEEQPNLKADFLGKTVRQSKRTGTGNFGKRIG